MRFTAWKSSRRGNKNGHKPNRGPSLDGIAAKLRHLEIGLRDIEDRVTRVERRLKGDAVSASKAKAKENRLPYPLSNRQMLNG